MEKSDGEFHLCFPSKQKQKQPVGKKEKKEREIEKEKEKKRSINEHSNQTKNKFRSNEFSLKGIRGSCQMLVTVAHFQFYDKEIRLSNANFQGNGSNASNRSIPNRIIFKQKRQLMIILIFSFCCFSWVAISSGLKEKNVLNPVVTNKLRLNSDLVVIAR